MNVSVQTLYHILVVLFAVDALAVLGVALRKLYRRRVFRRTYLFKERFLRSVLRDDWSGLSRMCGGRSSRRITAVRQVLEAVRDDEHRRRALEALIKQSRAWRLASRRARSRWTYRRLRAYLLLGALPDPGAARDLLQALSRERDRFLRSIVLNLVARSAALVSARDLIDTLGTMPLPIGPDDMVLLEPASPYLDHYFGPLLGNASADAVLQLPGWQQLLVCLCVSAHPSRQGWTLLSGVAERRDDEIGVYACQTLARVFPPSWFLESFANHHAPRFMLPYARLLGVDLRPAEVARLDPWFADDQLRPAGIAAASEVVRRHPAETHHLLHAVQTGNAHRRAALSIALESRLNYLVFHTPPQLLDGLRAVVGALLEQGRTGAILSALQTRIPPETRVAVVTELRERLPTLPRQSNFFARNADQAVRAELGVGEPDSEEDRPRIPVRPRDKVFIGMLVVLAMAIAPVVFVVRWYDALFAFTAGELLYRFIFDFHMLFAWYTMAVNAVYLIVLCLSAMKLFKQAAIWDSDLKYVLFSARLLPKITIVAPAYNEAETIVDSVESLLSLVYPDYEVVVVNDGSKDATLDRLKRAFDLEPISPGSEHAFPSMPITTVYRSAAVPNVRVIDKVNGGKADALNAGLNYAFGDYVCCIDADSLLAPESLLRIMTQVVASPRPAIAVGGNVFPVNGSHVEHGHLRHIGLPRAPLAALQTIEYIRSFISGRLGWASLDGLLIISGAFGVFRMDRLVEVSGYMTGKGRYRKDTVGEDMELVVRLIRNERERKRDGMIDYCYNASCWTEVPEVSASLQRQRDRWHRGLIEVLLHHRTMAFRPRYGSSGMVSVPYFFLFELIGPWLEMLGYTVLGVSFLFALIDPIISLIVFGIAVFFGILISVSSILLAEMQVVYFSVPDFIRLLGLSILENFGFRQWMSMSRVSAFVQFLYKTKDWQKFARKGFRTAAPGAQ